MYSDELMEYLKAREKLCFENWQMYKFEKADKEQELFWLGAWREARATANHVFKQKPDIKAMTDEFEKYGTN